MTDRRTWQAASTFLLPLFLVASVAIVYFAISIPRSEVDPGFEQVVRRRAGISLEEDRDQALASIRQLDLRHEQLNSIEGVSRLSNLEELRIRGNGGSRDNSRKDEETLGSVYEISGIPLKRLEISMMILPEDLSKCFPESLEELILSDTNVKSLEFVHDLPNLRCLVLSGTNLYSVNELFELDLYLRQNHRHTSLLIDISSTPLAAAILSNLSNQRIRDLYMYNSGDVLDLVLSRGDDYSCIGP